MTLLHKKITKLSIVLIVGVIVGGCTQPVGSNRLVGTWATKDLGAENARRPRRLHESCHIETYRADGTFLISRTFLYEDDEKQKIIDGTYHIDENVLRIDFIGHDKDRQPTPAFETIHIEFQGDDSFFAKGMIGQEVGKPATRQDLSQFEGDSIRVRYGSTCK